MTPKRKASPRSPKPAPMNPQPENLERVQSASRSVNTQRAQAIRQTVNTGRKHNARLQAALYQISQATNSTRNLQELFGEIHQILGELMPAKNFFIALHDPTADVLSFPYFVDEHDDPPSPMRARRGLTEYVLHTGKSLLADPGRF